MNGVTRLIHPLTEFADLLGPDAPVMEGIAGETMPEPYRSLLVHQGDMTPTLEAYHGDTLYLERRRHHAGELVYSREVVLRRARDQAPVEYGVIQIQLAAFPLAAVTEILAARIPLGTIFRRHAIAHESRPWGFLRARPNKTLRELYGIDDQTVLYGRLNLLRTLAGATLAEVIEILPPAPVAPPHDPGAA